MTKPPIAPVLEHYGWDGRVGGNGAWQTTRCPFHGDQHASARVNLDEGAFHCNACDISGDVYAIVMSQEGVDFATAKQRVQAITGSGNSDVRGGPSRLAVRGASSKLPSWTRDKDRPNRRLSSRGGRRDHS